MKNPLVRIPIIVIIVAIVASVLWNKLSPAPVDQTSTPAATTTPQATDPVSAATSLCYYRSTKTTSGFNDTAYLTMTITGSKVTGEFHNLPSEKDSATGTFTGSIDTNDTTALSKIATVWWNQVAEGMQSVNELMVVYDTAKATVGFGEMVKTDDTTYVYKDKTSLTYIAPMPTINCDTLTEMTTVGQYIKDNIKTITVYADPVTAGNTWFVLSTTVDPTLHTALVMYTDGHATHKATITYTYDSNAKITTITAFTKI